MYLKCGCILFVIYVILGNNVECFMSGLKTEEVKSYLSTKTPYRFVANMNMNDTFDFPGCQPKRIWMMIRHGTRNPGKKLIKKINERLPFIRDKIFISDTVKHDTLTPEQLQAIKNWKRSISEEDQKILAHEGEDEMLLLGERMQNRFPNILVDLYHNDTYKFRHTATQRAQESARYFTIGMFGRHVANHVWYPQALRLDPILRFYKLCEKWRAHVDKNPDALIEKTKFEGSETVKNAVNGIARRLGLPANLLTLDDLYAMYDTCGFETSWEKYKTSPWCDVFSKKDFQVLEYLNDLEYYYIDGYGYDLTYQQACVAMKDMFEHIERTDEKDIGTFYFSHSGTILKLIAHLGLYKDAKPLTYKMNNNRKWRVSHIDAFASNLAFVKYQCNNVEKVLLLHQEHPIQIPNCPKSGLCSLKTLKRVFKKSIENCDFEAMCSLPKAAAPAA